MLLHEKKDAGLYKKREVKTAAASHEYEGPFFFGTNPYQYHHRVTNQLFTSNREKKMTMLRATCQTDLIITFSFLFEIFFIPLILLPIVRRDEESSL